MILSDLRGFFQTTPGEKRFAVLRMPWREGRFARFRRGEREKRPAQTEGALTAVKSVQCKLSAAPLTLQSEVQFQAELELSRVIGGSRAAVVATVAGALLEGVNVVDESRSGAFIEPIE